MVNLNDDELTTMNGTVLADIKDACAGVSAARDAIDYVSVDEVEMLDPVEVRERIIHIACIMNDLSRCLCKYAALARAYEETLSACGGDIKKLLEPEKVAERVRKIRESLRRVVMEMTADAAAKQFVRV